MTRDETVKVLMMIQAAYPNYNPPDKTVTVNLWNGMLQDYSYEQVSAAIKAYIRTDQKGFAPSVGEVVGKLQLLFGNSEDLNALEAWTLVLKAIKNSAYHSDEEFEKLPELVKKAVGSPMQLKEWAISEVNDNTVSGWQTKFMSTYKLECARDSERKMLSPDLLKMIENKRTDRNIIEQKPIEYIETTKEEIAMGIPDRAKNRLQEIFGRDFN